MVSCDDSGDNGRDNRRGDGRGGFQTRPFGAVHMVSLGSHGAPHGFAIGSGHIEPIAKLYISAVLADSAVPRWYGQV